jgi:hypothetical protein
MYPLPDADQQRSEALRNQMREAILRQDLPSMDALLLQIQQSLIRDGQRRTDLTRIGESRMAEVMVALNSLAQGDGASVPELLRWQADTRLSAAAILDALSRWDVVSARKAEARLNALADEVSNIRKRVQGELRLAAAITTAREVTQRERTVRRAEMGKELDEGNLFWRSIRVGGSVIGVLGASGAFMGLTVIAVAFALKLTTPWDGSLGLATTIIFAALVTSIGAMVGTKRLRARRLATAKAAASLDSELGSEARALAELHRRMEAMQNILEWFRI